MSERDRAEVLHKYKSCARCLSWRHNRSSSDCKAPKNSCGLVQPSGGKCTGDHSKMVCGSGHAYTASARVHRSEQSVCGAEQIVTSEDLEADVMMLLEDVAVRLGDKSCSARVFWDDESNRILISSSFEPP